MVISAVLPPSTGWGFQYSSASVPATPEKHEMINPFTTQQVQTEPRLSHKRKNHSPDRIDVDHSDEERFNRPMATPTRSKRARMSNGHGLHGLPISRLIETLDRKGLQNLIESACQANPAVAAQISATAPRVTVDSAVQNLRSYLQAVYTHLPYTGKGGDDRNDYAYLRVRGYIEEFLSAFADYTSHFLPPNESQPSNTLAFLDNATSLLHNLPVWTDGINNHQRNMAYEELNSAWIFAIKEASKKANGLGLAHGGWEHKLARHNEASNNRLQSALNYLNQELSWLNCMQPNNYNLFDASRQVSPSRATVWE